MKLFFQGDISAVEAGLNILSGEFNFELDPNGLKVVVENKPGCNIHEKQNHTDWLS